MNKRVKVSIFSLISILFISGCANRGQIIQQGCQKGMYCYKNINFGVSRGKTYEKGIRDGCKTGEGRFTKNYYLSSRDKNYFDGWILGRSKCKQILPNEGTILAEQKSRQRAEYQIRLLKMQKEQEPEIESVVDSLLDSSDNMEDLEY